MHVAHADPLHVAAWNRLRREYGLSTSDARTFCHNAVRSRKGASMGDVYKSILNGSLVSPSGSTTEDR